MEACILISKPYKKILKTSAPFRLEDRDAFMSPRWRSRSRSLRFWIKNLDSAQRLPGSFLGILWVARVDGHFPLAGLGP
jgi:hypothetical protein